MATHLKNPRLFTLVSAFGAVAVALILSFPATAEETAPAVLDASLVKHEVALKSLRPERGPIRLMGMQNNATVSFPAPARQELSDIELALFVTNSIALNNRSHMAVSVNGTVIGQIPFRSQYPETRARISIPAELIAPGYNHVNFSVAQISSDTCEDQSAPDLWSEIDTLRSTISYSVKAKPIQPSLSELPQLIDRRLLGNYTLTIATAAQPGASVIEAGGLVAQAAALSRDYAPLGIRHATLPVPPSGGAAIDNLPDDLFNGGDGVLIGSRDLLKPWLNKKSYGLAAEPLVALFPFGANKDRFVLVVTGADDGQVRQAAQALVQSFFKLPPVAMTNIREMTAIATAQRPTLQAGVHHTFSDFNFHTATGKGIYPESMAVRFWVPADHFAYPNSKLDLSLHLAYGAGFGPQSVLNIFLNDHFEHAVRLSEPPGAAYYDYQVAIPVTSLVPGWNELHFRPSLIPQRAEGQCQPIYTENLLFTLFDDSTLMVDDMQQLTALPDLALMGRTSFPFAGGRSMAPVRLALTGHESGILEAAWTLQAKLAQVNREPIIGMRLVTPEKVEGNTLLVGVLDRVPESLLSRSHLHHPGWWQGGKAKRSMNNLMELFGSKAIADEATGNNPKGGAKTALGDLLDSSIVMTQFESPHRMGESVILVAANSPELLSKQVATLVDDAYWGQLTGGTVVMGRDSETVRNYEGGRTYLLGNAGLKARIAHLFSRNKTVAIGVIMATLFFFALISWRMLLAYRSRQHEGRAG